MSKEGRSWKSRRSSRVGSHGDSGRPDCDRSDVPGLWQIQFSDAKKLCQTHPNDSEVQLLRIEWHLGARASRPQPAFSLENSLNKGTEGEAYRGTPQTPLKSPLSKGDVSSIVVRQRSSIGRIAPQVCRAAIASLDPARDAEKTGLLRDFTPSDHHPKKISDS